jgi:hypothetical protein
LVYIAAQNPPYADGSAIPRLGANCIRPIPVGAVRESPEPYPYGFANILINIAIINME